MTDTVIAASGLHKHYDEVRAVDGIELDIARGECFGLLGHNGAGKTTTIRMLTCRTRPTSGNATVLGHDILEARHEIRPRISLVSDQQNLHPRLSARATLQFWGALYGADLDRVDGLLQLVGLEPERATPVRDYSTGMRQRLVIARALVNEPEVIFLDEPTRGLDPASSRTLRGIVRNLLDGGTTVFLTTHDMAEADELCDRVAFMSSGRLVAVDSPRALRLAHVERTGVGMAVTLDDGAQLELRIDDVADRLRFDELAAAGRVRTAHTTEPTLADVFVDLVGRPLDEAASQVAEAS
ncbi:MAG: transporter related protein [Thermoleophilia bacterium]|nr:transporter related protein [Thermoleophilia bacterium]